MKKNKVRLVENVIDDLFRFIRRLVPIIFAFALGYLLCHYQNVEAIIQNNSHLNVTCSLDSLPPVIIQGCSPKTGA